MKLIFGVENSEDDRDHHEIIYLDLQSFQWVALCYKRSGYYIGLPQGEGGETPM